MHVNCRLSQKKGTCWVLYVQASFKGFPISKAFWIFYKSLQIKNLSQKFDEMSGLCKGTSFKTPVWTYICRKSDMLTLVRGHFLPHKESRLTDFHLFDCKNYENDWNFWFIYSQQTKNINLFENANILFVCLIETVITRACVCQW